MFYYLVNGGIIAFRDINIKRMKTKIIYRLNYFLNSVLIKVFEGNYFRINRHPKFCIVNFAMRILPQRTDCNILKLLNHKPITHWDVGL